ncbi:hypothetical protein [Prosthecobacter sp.]|uniref:hypothetical protein n=1 Tax=Prosthecobacter sp. TaxID=1965333 RepID=UPI0037838867
MGIKQITLPDFLSHAAEELQAVEQNHTLIELMRDGRIVAYLSPASRPTGNTGTLADWAGTGAGYTLAEGCSLEDPAFSPEEWEEFPETHA